MSQSEWEWKFLLGGLFSAADADKVRPPLHIADDRTQRSFQKIHGDWSDILLREVLNGKCASTMNAESRLQSAADLHP